jgi:hypothetical protein
MMPWLAVFGLVAFIIIGLVWACCAVGGAADDSFDDAWAAANDRWEAPRNHLANSDGLKKAGNVINHERDSSRG